MSSQQNVTTAEPISEENVAEYLRKHPEFFEQHPQLLAIMKLQHPTTGDAISLIERQIAVLREQNRSLERKLMELVQIARENEQLSTLLHSFSNELLKSRCLSDVVAVTQDKVRELFQTDFVVLRLLPDISDDNELCLHDEQSEQLFAEVLSSDKPLCGRIRPEQLSYLFTSNTEEVASAAIVPLKAAKSLGLLGLGSREADQFNPEMGALFLTHLGDLLSSAIAVHTGE